MQIKIESDVSVKNEEGSQMPQLFNLRAPVFLQEPTPVGNPLFFSAFIFMHENTGNCSSTIPES